ncbi:hypothetical protein BDZ91DRAFT_734085 [Kalaharituber pfeilii]|nr:hypothetical protein BDZ91DRAFT_734085 [Kalaharituber pfeilii]
MPSPCPAHRAKAHIRRDLLLLLISVICKCRRPMARSLLAPGFETGSRLLCLRSRPLGSGLPARLFLAVFPPRAFIDIVMPCFGRTAFSFPFRPYLYSAATFCWITGSAALSPPAPHIPLVSCWQRALARSAHVASLCCSSLNQTALVPVIPSNLILARATWET